MTCRECKFYLKDETALPLPAGHCHRYPPEVTWDTEINAGVCYWPYVEAGDFCGEYAPR